MRTSITRISSRPDRAAGFTFLELLVVVTLVAILTGTVVLGFAGADTQQEAKGFAQRFAQRVELARQQALQRNREWGVFISERDYSFAELDPEFQEWVPQPQRPFNHAELPAYLMLELETQDVGELPFADDEDEDLPGLLIFSSGEITPFSLAFRPEIEVSTWVVRSDGLSHTRARQEGDEDPT